MAKREENFLTKKKGGKSDISFFSEKMERNWGGCFWGGFLVEDRVFGRFVKKT
jgi:hypothetical protein